MKECPVCNKSDIKPNAEDCPRCGWNKLGHRLNATDDDRTELENARSAWRVKKANEARQKEAEVDPRRSENFHHANKQVADGEVEPRPSENLLPYYDFMLIGHSSVGKTTYLAMLCEQGGNKNQDWDFQSYGKAHKLGKNAPEEIRKKAKNDERIINSIETVSKKTLEYITDIVKKIKQQNGLYSNIQEKELVFSFRPNRADTKDKHTLLTLDYPGEWLANREDALYQKKMAQFANYLNVSQSLIIMIDPLVFLEGDFIEENFHTKGLADAASLLLKGSATKKRPLEFVPVEQMPVAIIINKYDLLTVALEKKKISQKEYNDPIAFLQGKCHNVLSDVKSFTTNWDAFFVSCYGKELPLEKLNEQGAYAPPAKPKPIDLEKPLNWLYKKTQKRASKEAWFKRGEKAVKLGEKAVKLGKKPVQVVLLLLLAISALYYGTYYSIYAWDSSAFEDIEAKEPTYLDQPHILYRDYSNYDDSHWFSGWTGFKEKVHEKRKKFVRLYLKNQLEGPLKYDAPVEDFKATRAQVRKWCLDLDDRDFSSEMESDLSDKLMPLYEEQYIKFLRDKMLRGEKDNDAAREFLRLFPLFPNSKHTPGPEEIYAEIWALEQYKQIYQMIVNSQTKATDVNKLLQLCREYLYTTKKHNHTYGSSVHALITFIENDLARVDKKGRLYPRTFHIGYRGYSISEEMYGYHTEESQEPYEDCDTDGSGLFSRTICGKAQQEVKTQAQVVISVAVDGVEKYSLDASRRNHDNLSIDWMPGMTVQVFVNNKTGGTTKTENSGFIAINMLKGELSVNGLATVKFTGSDLSVPDMQAPSEKLYVQNQAVIYQKAETIHLGDEELSSQRWKPLHGECFTMTFYVNRRVQTLALKMDIWGSESRLNAIFLNGTKVAVLPYQDRRTRKWITETVVLQKNELRSNRNQLKICSGLIEGGDKDDLQIRKLKLIVE
ncbi:MAG: hypothetical protein DRR19_02325 [Candidatus Parabeggiatoa sp. nov. 1]|nr:MAG: hypothetical protein DRR19_02325 [Gammaproteobacteria bacterium]